MKRMIAAVLVTGTLGGLCSGCSLFGKKEDDTQQGGGDQSGAQQQQGGGFDATTMIQATSPVPVTPDMKVGWHIKQEMKSSGQNMATSYSIVGETADSWQMEHMNPSLAGMANSMPDLKGMIIGLTVRKEDGKVTKAVLGKPGEAGKEIKINEMTPGEAKAPEGTPEDVKLKIGTFPAKKFVNDLGQAGKSTSWVGNGGGLDGVLLKSEGAGGSYELKKEPSDSTVKVGDTSLTVTEYAYTNGMTYWISAGDPIVAAFFPYGKEGRGIYKMTTDSTQMEVVELGSAAKPQLKW